MTATAAARAGKVTDGIIVAFPVLASTTIYRHTLVTIGKPGQATNVKGHLKNLLVADVATHEVVGTAVETVDNSSGAAGALDANVRVDAHVVDLVASSMTADDDLGKIAWAIDNQTVTKTQAAASFNIGKFARIISATRALVKFRGWVQGTSDTNAAQSFLIGNQQAASTAVTNTTTETAFDENVPIPAAFLIAGDEIEITGSGIATATNSTDTLIVRVKIAAVELWLSPTVDVADNDTWSFKITGTVRSLGASGVVIFRSLGHGPDAATVTSDSGKQVSATVDTTGALSITSTAEWSVASASNSCRSDALAVKVMRRAA